MSERVGLGNEKEFKDEWKDFKISREGFKMNKKDEWKAFKMNKSVLRN